MGALVGVVLLLASAAGDGAGREAGRGESPARVRRAFFGLSPAVHLGVGALNTGFFVGGDLTALLQVELGPVALRFSLPAGLGVSGLIDTTAPSTTWATGLGVEVRIGLVKGFSLGAGALFSVWLVWVRGMYALGQVGLTPSLAVAWRSGRHELGVEAQLVLPLNAFSALPFLVGPRYVIFF